jgi:hypothetical protein
MSNNISCLTIRAIDELNRLVRVQKLIQLCLEEDTYSPDSQDRLVLLLECYESRMSLHVDELKTYLHTLLLEARMLGESEVNHDNLQVICSFRLRPQGSPGTYDQVSPQSHQSSNADTAY